MQTRERDKIKGIRDKAGYRAFAPLFTPEHDKRGRVAICVALILSLYGSPAFLLQGADGNTDAVEKKALHQSSLGVPYVEIAETPVLFARWETRVADFEVFVKETNYDWKERTYFPQTGDHPVVNVNLHDAAAFCEWLTKRERTSGSINDKQHYRLPTNEEWDMVSAVAVQTDPTKKNPEESYPWGKQWPPLPRAGNFNSVELDGTDDGFAYTAPVGNFQPSEQGICDLAGNVWEWVQDGASPSADATVRGGSWQYFSRECLQSSYRYTVPSKLRRASVGFRCVFVDETRIQAMLVSRKQTLQEKGVELTSRTKATQEEVEMLKRKLSEKSALTEDEKLAARDRLLNDRSDRGSFVNSLGIAFIALPDGSGLLSTRELRSKDMAVWASMTGKKVSASTQLNPAEATAFCEWLASRERAQKKIGEKASYRLATEAERIAVAGFGVREEQDFRMVLINQSL